MTDYSQSHEQEHILEFFRKKLGHASGRFLDIGAFDGVTGSNTLALAEMGWSGLCVEPDPANFVKLMERHKTSALVECLLAAVGPSASVHRFHGNANQNSTAVNFKRLNQEEVQCYHVLSITPEAIAWNFGRKFDFVSIDAEQMEYDILRAAAPVLEAASLLCIEEVADKSADENTAIYRLACSMGFTQRIARTTCYNKDNEYTNWLLARV